MLNDAEGALLVVVANVAALLLVHRLNGLLMDCDVRVVIGLNLIQGRGL